MLTRALARLRTWGVDAERRNLRCWFGAKPLDAQQGLKALSELARLRTSQPDSFWARALEGKVRSDMGQMEAAGEELDAAIRSSLGPPEQALALSWRGELAVLRDDLDSARSDLDEALRLDPAQPWALVFRTAAHSKLGRYGEAESDVARLRLLRPKWSPAHALAAVLEAQQGRLGRALALLEAIGPAPGSGWLFALRGTLKARAGKLDSARRDLDLAVRSGESPWVLSERAEVLDKMGLFWLALRDLDRLSAKMPADPRPLVSSVRIHLAQAQYPQALAKLHRSIRLRPRDASLRRLRASAHSVRGDFGAAALDLRQACRLEPGDLGLREELARALVVLDRRAAARSLLRRSALPLGTRELLEGIILCRLGRHGEAARSFGRAVERTGAHAGLTERARFYRCVARSLDSTDVPPETHKGPALHLIGLGYRHPFQVSLEALRALSRCQVLYCNLSDSRVAEFLGLFPASIRPIVFRRHDRQAEACTRSILSGFRSASQVALVTRSNPLVYGRLAYRLTQECSRRSIRCEVPASVSIFEVVPCLADPAGTPGGKLGIQVRDPSSLQHGLDPGLPLVIYLPTSRHGGLDILHEVLIRHYPPTHVCYLLAGAGQNEFAPEPLPVRDLLPALRRSDPACTLFVPALTP